MAPARTTGEMTQENPPLRRLGDFEIVGQVGRGGFGTVYKARDTTLGGRIVALKVLNSDLAADADWVKRFQREASIAANLDHLAIPVIHRFGEFGGRIFIAMQFVPGQNLATLSRDEGPMAVDRMIALLTPVAEALDYAHSEGVVHRDIKPGNILVDQSGRSWLLDFGLARPTVTFATPNPYTHAPGIPSGTLPYISPEQFQNDLPGPAADRYAIGVTAYELLTRELPFTANNIEAMRLKVVANAPPSVRCVRSDVPELVDSAIKRMLAKSPSDRFPTTYEFVRALGGASTAPATVTRIPPVNSSAGVAEMFEAVRGSVVQVVTSRGAGSGVGVAEGIVTNAHVVGVDRSITIVTADGQQASGTVRMVDEVADLALVECASRVPVMAMADAARMRVGDAVYVMGFPRSDVLLGAASLTRGILSGFRMKDGVPLVQTDAAMNPGNSGGALVSHTGRLVGIATFGIRETEGMNFAVSVTGVTEFLLRKRSRRRRTQTGVPDAHPQPRQHLVVDQSGQGTHYTIGEAIGQAELGQVILVKPGWYREALVVDRHVELIGDGDRSRIVVEATGTHAVTSTADNATVRNLTIRTVGASGTKCGAVLVSRGRVLIERCDLTSSNGAVVYITGADSDPLVRDCEIRDSIKGTGVHVNDHAQGRIDGCRIHGNAFAGVSIKTEANPVVSDCDIRDGEGVGVHVRLNGRGTIERCRIFRNSLSAVEISTGGDPVVRACSIFAGKRTGVYVNENGRGTIEHSDIHGNAGTGVEITTGGNPIVRDTTIRDGGQHGIAVHRDGLGTIKKCPISGNAKAGVAISEGGNPELLDCEIRDGRSTGVIVFDRGIGKVERCVISENATSGVEIRTGGNPAVRDCEIRNGKHFGISVVDQGRGLIDQCRIYGNFLAGVAIRNHGNPCISDCEISYGLSEGVIVYERGIGIIDRCLIHGNARSGVAISTGGNPTVRACKIYRGMENGIFVHHEGRGTVEGCPMISENAKAGVSISVGGNPVLRDCGVHGNTEAGIWVQEQGLGSIEKCRIYGNKQAGLAIMTGGNPMVRDCEINGGNQHGVAVYLRGRGTIDLCRIHGNSLAGVQIMTGGNPVVRDCEIRDGKQAGILVSEMGQGVVERCRIFRNAMSGVQINTGGNPTIRNCEIGNGKQHGVYVRERGGGIIERCWIFGNALAGVAVNTGGNPSIHDCNIHDNAGAGVYIHYLGEGRYVGNTFAKNAFGAWKIEGILGEITRLRNTPNS